MPTEALRPKLDPDPHDTYVKKVFGELPQARAFFRACLPENPDRGAAAKRHMESDPDVIQ